MDETKKFDFLWTVQNILHTTSVLSIMVDSTMRSIDGMYSWRFSTKDEMKQLGGTLLQMQWKLRELMTLACVKMVDDAFNNINEFRPEKLKLHSPESKQATYLQEVDRLRHIANVIKHNNSFIDTKLGNSAMILVNEHGAPNEIELQSFDQKYGKELRDDLLRSIFYCHRFCMSLIESLGFFSNKSLFSEPDDIPDYMLRTFVHSLPGHPNCETH